MVSKLGKTYINPKLLKFTRNFSQLEINTWKKEDHLPKTLIKKLGKAIVSCGDILSPVGANDWEALK